MTLRVTRFAGEYAAIAARTGDDEAVLRADEDYTSGEREHWLAWDGATLAGLLHPWHAPDGRVRLYFEACRPDAYAALAGAVTSACLATVGEDDEQAWAGLAAAGFAEVRREREYEMPVRVPDAPVPDGLRVVTGDATALEPLMMLDCALRQEVPGADGWQPDPDWFRAETYESPDYDPLTYRVALDGDAYVGLARVWNGPVPRLGLIGVLPGYRRRGLARALIARAFAPLASRGVSVVTAEADAGNLASHTLLTGLGARITGTAVELGRPAVGAG